MAHAHHDKPSKPLWLIKPHLDAAEYRDKLMGAVVKYADMPTESRMPYRAPFARDIVPDLDPKPVQVRNVKFWTRRVNDAGVSASLNDIVEFFAERAKEDNLENVATVARVWHMDSPDRKFQELLKNKEYFEELFDLLHSNGGHGYFITHIVTFANLEITDETTRTKGVGAGAGVAVDPTGLGVGLTVSAKAKLQVVREKGFSACYDEETIVFLGYRLIRLDKVEGTRARLGRMVLGQRRGYTVRDGMDYWPTLVERPVEGSASFMDPPPPLPPQEKVSEEDQAIIDGLTFDVEIVG